MGFIILLQVQTNLIRLSMVGIWRADPDLSAIEKVVGLRTSTARGFVDVDPNTTGGCCRPGWRMSMRSCRSVSQRC